MICDNKTLIDLVYKSVKFHDLVANMNVFKDFETSRHSFHIAKTFMKYNRMQSELLKRKKEVIEAIMDCIRDKEIPLENKRECL